jgi:hypothetical protein
MTKARHRPPALSRRWRAAEVERLATVIGVHERRDPEANGVAAVDGAWPLTFWPHASPAQMQPDGFTVRVVVCQSVACRRSGAPDLR